MARLFIALTLDAAAKDTLASLAGDLPGARWVGSENYHITLKFLGEVGSTRQADLVHALDRIEAPVVPLDLKGVGVFPLRGEPETLWVGVGTGAGHASNPPLLSLQRRIEQALIRKGFAPEARNFHPHVTLARLQGVDPVAVAQFLTQHALFSMPGLIAKGFGLYSSRLMAGGSIYTEEEHFPLFGVTGDEDEEDESEADDEDA